MKVLKNTDVRPYLSPQGSTSAEILQSINQQGISMSPRTLKRTLQRAMKNSEIRKTRVTRNLTDLKKTPVSCIIYRAIHASPEPVENTIDWCIGQWKLTQLQPTFSKHTLDKYRPSIRRVMGAEFTQRTAIQNISRETIQGFLDQEPKIPACVRTSFLFGFSALSQWAISRGLITHNPCDGFSRKKGIFIEEEEKDQPQPPASEDIHAASAPQQPLVAPNIPRRDVWAIYEQSTRITVFQLEGTVLQCPKDKPPEISDLGQIVEVSGDLIPGTGLLEATIQRGTCGGFSINFLPLDSYLLTTDPKKILAYAVKSQTGLIVSPEFAAALTKSYAGPQ